MSIVSPVDGDPLDPQWAQDITDAVNALLGLGAAWVPYTPIWSAAGTQPVLGNGALSGRYLKSGRFVVAGFRLAAGTTTTFGTGEWSFSPPVAADANLDWIGSAVLLDSGTTRYAGSCSLIAASGLIEVVTGSANFIHATSPFVWTNGDTLNVEVTMQSVS